MKLASRILIPFVVFLVFIAVMGLVMVVHLGHAVGALGGTTAQSVAATRALVVTFVAVSVLIVLLLIVFYAVIVRTMTRRLHYLIELTGEVEAGKFPALIAPEGHDEIAELTQAFADMNHRLQQSYRQLREHQEQLARSEKLASLGQLASSVAHEVNTPNGIISMYAQILLKRDDLPDDVCKELATIQAESGRIAGIIREILDYSRPRPPQKTTFDLAALVRQTSATLKPHLAGMPVTVTAVPESITVFGDPDRIRQVLINVLNNARDAVAGEGTAAISIAADDGTAVVKIADNGPGIPAAELTRVFDPFYTTKGKNEGSGLGLAICHRIIVDEHNGALEIASRPGQGTTIIFRLPTKEPDGCIQTGGADTPSC